MSRAFRPLLALLVAASLAWAASGIEVLSHSVTEDGIEVLSHCDEGLSMVAFRLVAGSWVAVDAAEIDADGQATLLFDDLEPQEARIVVYGAAGIVIDSVTYVGDLDWK